MEAVHKSVLLKECLEILKPNSSDALLIDGTLGEGGHTQAFLQKYPQLKAVGVDADCDIQKYAQERLASFGDRIMLYNCWSDDFFKMYPSDLKKPDIIFFDLGISMFHYVKSGRGFSFSNNEPLDMRLNALSKLNAADIVNSFSETELADLIFIYGEERYSRRIARKIIEQREIDKIQTAKDLADCVVRAVPKSYRYGKIHPATRTFQALRIAVNSELERLPRLLKLAFSVLSPGGKLGVISFHSLEDRIVKLYFRELSKSCICPETVPICTCGGKPRALLLTKKGVEASKEEVDNNPASRSARLRAVQKVEYMENCK